ncbi:MAG: outer membrane beta-barrel domain-containing protein [Burkholderiaceae bacterium]|jgi:outer membrane beta-barrel protein|nr:outer membrane beta-barrel domain-containing protein [Burkholderiaceae bacterium]
MRILLAALFAATSAVLAVLPARAQTAGAPAATPAGQPPNQPANEQVIEPAVPRRDVRVPKIPSKDFIIGGFVGTYGTESFGASTVYGGRLGYHVTEDFFVEALYGSTKVSDENFRQILPGGIFPTQTERLEYYNISAGYNILPGEVFFGSRYATPAALYVIAGVGSTKFLDQTKQTLNFGLGLRVFLKDWAAIQVDFRDHVYSLDLLGKTKDTQNLELSAGLTIFF